MPGVFLGDYVKGRLTGQRPEEVELGIRFHRAVDAFVDSDPGQKTSVARLPPMFRRYGSIICDVVYDYFLANHWHQFSDIGYEPFCRQVYAQVLSREDLLGEPAKSTILRMRERGSLENYHTRAYVEASLTHIGRRLTKANPLAEAYGEFEKLEAELAADFFEFMPRTVQYANRWLEDRRTNS